METQVRIFDNGGETLDRYTILFEDNSMVGMSNNPFGPLGFNQYVGDLIGSDTDHLGEEVSMEDLNDDVKQAINQRLEQ